jgi:hypothetical protein
MDSYLSTLARYQEFYRTLVRWLISKIIILWAAKTVALESITRHEANSLNLIFLIAPGNTSYQTIYKEYFILVNDKRRVDWYLQLEWFGGANVTGNAKKLVSTQLRKAIEILQRALEKVKNVE